MDEIIEFLLSKENEDENFSTFCEENMIEKIILISEFKEKSINLIIIKTFGILIPSLKNDKIMFYLFSNNYMNQIIYNISYNKEDNDTDYLSFYINFLKTLANKLDINSFALFFSSTHNNFPLLDEIIIFLTYDQDVMIKNTSRNIFLSLLKLNYEPFIEYISDLPTITLFLLFAENLKKHIKYLCQNKENNNNNIIINNNNIDNDNNNNNSYSYKIKEIEEREEIIIDDISFIQDILSINIPKINYLLINTIFYIPISYLFNNILTRQYAHISYYILELFLKILKNQAIKNIIVFILYSSHIQIKIIEIVANEETVDNYKLLKLNKYLFHSNIGNIKTVINYNLNILSFDEYVILNYSKKFLNSLRYIKDTDNTYIELKDISNKLSFYENKDNDVSIQIKLLNKNVDRMNFVTKQIENYHGFISRATGINCGGADGAANDSFLQVIYKNLMAYKENNVNKNIYLQENIFKNECIFDLSSFHLNQYISSVNELFLLNEIINNEGISEKLKMNLNLLKNSIEKSKIENNNTIFFDINSIEDIDNNIIESIDNYNINENKKEEFQTLDTPPAPGVFENNNNINTKNKHYSDTNILNFSVIQNKNSDLYKHIFGENDKYENIHKNHLNLSTVLSLPNPVNNNIDITKFNNNINLIVDNKIMNYSDMDFNNEFFDKILLNYKNNNELIILENLVNLLLNGKRILNKLIYKLVIDIIEDLLLNSINFWTIKKKYQNKTNEHYKQILQMINDFLEKNSLIPHTQTMNNNFYEFFEDCFNFNTKNIDKDIKNNIFKIPILLTNPPNEENELYKIQFDLLKIPDEKYQTIKCLFQKMLSLYDLNYIINNFNDVNKDNLIKNQKFPLEFFDLSKFSIYSKINIIELNKLNIETYILKYKINDEEIFNDGIIFINKNYLFICSINNGNIKERKLSLPDKNIIKDEILSEIKYSTIKDDNDINKNKCDDYFCIIKQRIPLRNIEIKKEYKEELENKNQNQNNEQTIDKEKILILSVNKTLKFELLFDNVINNVKFEDMIKNNKKNAIEMECNALKMYFQKLLNDYSTINN